jgi:glutamate-ammonia-ligase adenylyltransferase
MADIHAMKRRVHSFKGHGEIAVAGHNVKLGRGGIREIEFFVQTHQLIAGGRQPELRARASMDVLEKLVDRDWVDRQTADELKEAYFFLRHVEHRLQMVADEQTHTLPKESNALQRVAQLSGFANTESFASELVAHLTRVQGHYDELFEKFPDPAAGRESVSFRGDDDDPEAMAALEEIGFTDAEKVVSIVRAWRSGRYAATRSEQARERLNEFLPSLLEALAATPEPDAALAAFDRFVAELPAGVQLFSLLRANPSLLRLIGDIVGTAPRLARVLGRRVQVLDAVLDPGFFGNLPTLEVFSELVSQDIGAAHDYQDCLDRARAVGTEQAFLIGVRVLSGTISAEQAGSAYAYLAESLIAALYDAVSQEIVRAHGTMPGGQAAVLAMGKLGGYEMTAASDLDLITVYDFDQVAQMSDGGRPLAGGQYYSRLTQRLISALTAPTAEGALYEVDMRLRPSGNAGPVATHFDSFVDYQENHAWTWEHLALTRSRVVAGPDPIRSKIEKMITQILSRPRDREKVAADVHEMRKRISDEKGTDDIWDLKQVRGGLVDLEFITQFHQVVFAHKQPDVLDQNISTGLAKLAEAGCLSSDDAEILMPASRLYNDITQLLRLCLERSFKPETASFALKDLLARASGQSDFEALEGRLRQTQISVHKAFDRLVR